MPEITGKTGLICLLGSPVAHSISPKMHNYSFQKTDLDYVYLCFDVKEEDLKTAVEGLKKLGVTGFNLTMPNKNKIIEYLDELSPEAKLIKAVNTVENRNGRLVGHNTDGKGFMQSVKEQEIFIENETITLLGMGGAATAICAQAALDGVGHIHVFGRKESSHRCRMEQMILELSHMSPCKITLHDIDNKADLKERLIESRLLVNATSIGMAPNVDQCLIPDFSFFHRKLAVCDIIYNPWKTKLLSMAEEAGCKCFNGYSMLLWQGAEAFKIWTGNEMPINLVREYLQKE